jgi:hypothetical protein
VIILKNEVKIEYQFTLNYYKSGILEYVTNALAEDVFGEILVRAIFSISEFPS